MRGVGRGIVRPTIRDRLFTPLAVSNLTAWWEFSDNALVTLNGSDISQLDDKSGNGHDLVQATASQQPHFSLGPADLRAAWGSDATNEQLTDASVAHNVGSDDFYLIAAVNLYDSANGYAALAAFGSFAPGFYSSSGAPNFYDAGDNTFSSLAFSVYQWDVIEFWRDGTSLRCRVNGTLDTDSITNSTDFGNTTSVSLLGDGATDTWDGNVGEAALYTALPASADRDNLQNYFDAKWRHGLGPLAVDNLKGWWDFSQTDGVTLNGSDVSQIEDHSALAHFAEQTVAAQQPLYTDGPNGRKVANFAQSPTTQSLLRASGNIWNIGTGDFYVIAHVNVGSIGTYRTVLSLGGVRPGLYIHSSGNPNLWDGSADNIFSSLSLTVDTDHIVEFWRDGTSIRCRVDNTIDTDSLTNSTDFLTNGNIRLGGDGSLALRGDMGELAFFDELPSSGERDALYTRFNLKWQ